MTKNEKRVVIVDAIVLVMFLVIAFVVPFRMNAVFWISLVFGVLAIGVQLYVLKSAFAKGEDIRSKFYGFPIAKIGIAYMAVQVVLSLVFMILAKFLDVPVWIPVIGYILILGIAALGFIAADATRDEVEHLDNKLVVDTECMQSLRSIVYPLAGQVKDTETKKVLENLADEFKYSDPVSSEAIKEIESELTELVSELQKAVVDGDNSAVKELGKKISVALTERNRLCKLNKNRN